MQLLGRKAAIFVRLTKCLKNIIAHLTKKCQMYFILSATATTAPIQMDGAACRFCYFLVVQQTFLFHTRFNEAFKQRMGAVRTALKFRMILNTDEKVVLRDLYGLDDEVVR